jgi:hypothetical protein
MSQGFKTFDQALQAWRSSLRSQIQDQITSLVLHVGEGTVERLTKDVDPQFRQVVTNTLRVLKKEQGLRDAEYEELCLYLVEQLMHSPHDQEWPQSEERGRRLWRFWQRWPT